MRCGQEGKPESDYPSLAIPLDVGYLRNDSGDILDRAIHGGGDFCDCCRSAVSKDSHNGEKDTGFSGFGDTSRIAQDRSKRGDDFIDGF